MLSRNIGLIDVSTFGNMKMARKSFRRFHNERTVFVFEEFDRSIRVIEENERKRERDGEIEISDLGIKSTIKITDDVPTFKVSDLLELLQGPVPEKGRIIIATTNHLEKMQADHPALFRPGRLTPVYFGYLDRDQISQLSMVYFNRKIELDRDPDLPTSQIVDIAIRGKISGGFEYFEKELKRISKIEE